MSINAAETQSWLAEHPRLTMPGESLPWLKQKRQDALAHFERVGLPGVRDEKWRYTNLRALKSNAYLPTTADSNKSVQLDDCNHQRLVFVDGFYRSDLSDVVELGDGIVFTSIAELLNSDAESSQSKLLESHLSVALPKTQHGFTALNSAYFQDGYALVLPKNAVVPAVLEVCFINSRNTLDAEASLSHTRNIIIADRNSQCTLVERHLGSDGEVYLNNSVTELHAGENAHIDHYKLHQEAEDAFHIGGVFIKQAANSQVKSHNIALSGLVTRNDISSELAGAGAHIEMNGLVVGRGRQHIDNHTEVNHAVANCTSDEYYRTILDDQSRSVFRGRIIVAQDAQLTNADQQNNNLLLSKNAEADTKPQLEIYADDVKCSHGATVGQLDPKSLFYLRSRGIDQDSATALLTFAFANEVIERIKVAEVREELIQLIAGQLLSGLEDLI
jgi:Fe-S cluster assembly protein SufD